MISGHKRKKKIETEDEKERIKGKKGATGIGQWNKQGKRKNVHLIKENE